MIETNIGTSMAIERIDPQVAETYLETISANRRTRAGKIDQYARDMSTGRWHSSVLRFDTEGRLVDGQHRLWAVIVSGSAQVFYVERGLSEDAVKTIDQGLSRTAGDVLAISGEASAISLASAIRYARWFEKHPGLAPSSQTREPFSPEEIIDYLKDNPGLRDAVRQGKALAKAIPYSGSLAAALQHLETKRNPELAKVFWDQMALGVEMKARTGPYLLRELVISDRLLPRDERMSVNTIAAVSIKAWNAWEQGREMKVLRWVRGPQFAESFPIIGE